MSNLEKIQTKNIPPSPAILFPIVETYVRNNASSGILTSAQALLGMAETTQQFHTINPFGTPALKMEKVEEETDPVIVEIRREIKEIDEEIKETFRKMYEITKDDTKDKKDTTTEDE